MITCNYSLCFTLMTCNYSMCFTLITCNYSLCLNPNSLCFVEVVKYVWCCVFLELFSFKPSLQYFCYFTLSLVISCSKNSESHGPFEAGCYGLNYQFFFINEVYCWNNICIYEFFLISNWLWILFWTNTKHVQINNSLSLNLAWMNMHVLLQTCII